MVGVFGDAHASVSWFNPEDSVSDNHTSANGSANAGAGGGPSYGNGQGQAHCTFDLSTLGFSGGASAGVGANGFGRPVNISAHGQTILQFGILKGDGPFLWRASGSVDGAHVHLGNNSGLNADFTGGGFLLAGLESQGLGIQAEAAASSFLTADGVANSSGSYSGGVEVNEDVLPPPSDIQIIAPSGVAEMVVNFPARVSYIGHTNPSSVVSIPSNPTSGSVFQAGSTLVNGVVNYIWNITGPAESFVVTIIPGFQPADIVRVSRDGQPVQVFYNAPPMPPARVSNVSFGNTSGSFFPLGETVVQGQADVPCVNCGGGLRTVNQTFKVTVFDGSSWGAAGQGVPANLLGDSDGDGVPDWQELIAGTDPNDKNSVFKLASLSLANGDVRVWFPAIGGNKYQLLCAPLGAGLALSNFVPVGDVLTETSPSLHLTNLVHVGGATNSSGRAYRVQITQ